jgi:hypothetical protein
MKIDVTRFCGLSRRDDFQNWLKSISNEYYNELIYFLRLGKSCGSNKEKMEEIYSKLVKDKKSNLMIDFLIKNYPHMIIYDKNDATSKIVEVPQNDKQMVLSNDKQMVLSNDELNHHKVFQKYKPGLLLIPHQMIFIDDNGRSLENRIIEFTRTKIQTDYVILQGPKFYHGYIEYFEKEFASEAFKLPSHNRPIFIYKKNNNLR